MYTLLGNLHTNDSNGNTLTGGGRTNVWDSQNRLAQCTFGAANSTFTYAADGIRHRTVTGANTTDYVLDGPMFVREKLNGAVSATYLVGPRGPEYRRDHATGTIRWYCYDGLGSVLGECDSSGNLTATRSYDVYGAVRTSAGTSTSKHKYVGSLGHPSEAESGLIYMQARYMDPVSGRFLSEDRSGNGTNWFAYCSNNPVAHVDPDGKEYTNTDLFTMGFLMASAAIAFILLSAYTGFFPFFVLAVVFAVAAAACFLTMFLGSSATYKVGVGAFSLGGAMTEKFLEPAFLRMLTGIMEGLEKANRLSLPGLSNALTKITVYTLAQVAALAAAELLE